MSGKPRQTSKRDQSQSGAGLKRRDLLLSSASRLAASALGAAGEMNTAEAQQGVPASTPAPGAAAAAEPDRTVLPLAEPTYPAITELDVRKTAAPPRFDVKAPQGAPNVIVILLDNLGYGPPKTFGGVINMPTLERLAKNGLIYNNFHRTPLCSPSRAALLTGRNAHSVNMGALAEIATAFPGYTSERPQSTAPLAEIVKLNGYSTAMFGKTHEFTPWELSVSGGHRPLYTRHLGLREGQERVHRDNQQSDDRAKENVS